MKRPRFSLAGLMVIVALVAAEFALLRLAVENSPSYEEFAVVSPMVMLLGVGLFPLFRSRNAAPRFLVGFEVVGWTATILWYLAIRGDSPLISSYFDGFVLPLMKKLFQVLRLAEWDAVLKTKYSLLFWCVKVPLILAFATAPPLGAALVGGSLWQRFKVTARLKRQPDSGEARNRPETEGVIHPR